MGVFGVCTFVGGLPDTYQLPRQRCRQWRAVKEMPLRPFYADGEADLCVCVCVCAAVEGLAIGRAAESGDVRC